MSVTNTKPWIEKFRPVTLENVISHEHIICALKQYIMKKTLPNLILYGSPGTGKTSIIRACSNELYGNASKIMTLEINASEERGIDIVRTRITQFANSHQTQTHNTITPYPKLIILDEADSMTVDAQIALKNVIDTFSFSTRFCLVCNCLKKIHFSLISRCIRFRLQPLQPMQIQMRIQNICASENIEITPDAINEIIKYSHGDMRRVVNVLQSIHTAYADNNCINEICVHTYLNLISPKTIEHIILLLFKHNICNACTTIDAIIRENGFSFHELISKISDIITEYLISTEQNKNYTAINNDILHILKQTDTKKLLEILRKLGKIEYQLFSNVPFSILLPKLSGIIKS